MKVVQDPAAARVNPAPAQAEVGLVDQVDPVDPVNLADPLDRGAQRRMVLPVMEVHLSRAPAKLQLSKLVQADLGKPAQVYLLILNQVHMAAIPIQSNLMNLVISKPSESSGSDLF